MPLDTSNNNKKGLLIYIYKILLLLVGILRASYMLGIPKLLKYLNCYLIVTSLRIQFSIDAVCQTPSTPIVTNKVSIQILYIILTINYQCNKLKLNEIYFRLIMSEKIGKNGLVR